MKTFGSIRLSLEGKVNLSMAKGLSMNRKGSRTERIPLEFVWTTNCWMCCVVYLCRRCRVHFWWRKPSILSITPQSGPTNSPRVLLKEKQHLATVHVHRPHRSTPLPTTSISTSTFAIMVCLFVCLCSQTRQESKL